METTLLHANSVQGTQTEQPPCPIIGLPDELLLEIFGYVDRGILLIVRQCCRRFNEVSFDKFAFRYFNSIEVVVERASLERLVAISRYERLRCHVKSLNIIYSAECRAGSQLLSQELFIVSEDALRLLTEALKNIWRLQRVEVNHCRSTCQEYGGSTFTHTFTITFLAIEHSGVQIDELVSGIHLTPNMFCMRSLQEPATSRLSQTKSFKFHLFSHHNTRMLLCEDKSNFLCRLNHLESLEFSVDGDVTSPFIEQFIPWLAGVQHHSQIGPEWISIFSEPPPSLHALRRLHLDFFWVPALEIIQLLHRIPALQHLTLKEIYLEQQSFVRNGFHYSHGGWCDLLSVLSEHFISTCQIESFVVRECAELRVSEGGFKDLCFREATAIEYQESSAARDTPQNDEFCQLTTHRHGTSFSAWLCRIRELVELRDTW